MNFWQNLSKPFFVLAPMDEVTDVVFRQIVAQVAPPDVLFTEFVATDGLQSPGRERTMERLRIEPNLTRPLVAQIWGSNPDNYYVSAKEIAAMGFAGIDINFGCPERGIVARGCCGGMIGRYDEAAAIIEATKRGAGDIPVSVKTRTGLGEVITEQWASFLLEQNLAALTIHGRTVRQMSKVPAQWDEIAKVVALRNKLSPETLIIGNGDVANHAEGMQRVAETGVDGIMIGRGIFSDIFAFSSQPSLAGATPQQRLAILLDHVEIYESSGSKKPFHILKKFFKVYVSGWWGAGELRAGLMEATTPDEVRNIIANAQVPDTMLAQA